MFGTPPLASKFSNPGLILLSVSSFLSESTLLLPTLPFLALAHSMCTSLSLHRHAEWHNSPNQWQCPWNPPPSCCPSPLHVLSLPNEALIPLVALLLPVFFAAFVLVLAVALANAHVMTFAVTLGVPAQCLDLPRLPIIRYGRPPCVSDTSSEHMAVKSLSTAFRLHSEMLTISSRTSL
jgi:hypothetical protein